MKKIFVLHENNDWTRHLQVRLEELNLPFEMWHLDQGLLDLTSEPPEGVFYNRISASSHTRDHRYAPEYTAAVLAWLERHGRTVVNGSKALSLEISKANQTMALNLADIATPKTIVAVGKQHIKDAARVLLESSLTISNETLTETTTSLSTTPSTARPFITKHNRAGKGQGVQLFDSIDALERYVDGPNFDAPIDGLTLVQEYIEAPEPFIIRHEFIGGKFLYAVKVDTSEGFELCPADACSIEDLVCPASAITPALVEGATNQKPAKFEILTNYRPAFIDKYEAFLAENEIQVAGIEAIMDKNGNSYAYDVNTNTNYNSDAEAVAGQYAMRELALYLQSLL